MIPNNEEHYKIFDVYFFVFRLYVKRKQAPYMSAKTNSYTSVQKGIDAAVTGDTVLVDPGIIKEHDITINKKIYVKGLQYPVIDGEKKRGHFYYSCQRCGARWF